MRTGLENATTHAAQDGPPISASETVPSAAVGQEAGVPNFEEMMRNMGGGGAGGGMPDLAGLMSNPMMRQMAERMMANGGLERMMQNPAVANMVGIRFTTRSCYETNDGPRRIDEQHEVWWRDAINGGPDVGS